MQQFQQSLAMSNVYSTYHSPEIVFKKIRGIAKGFTGNIASLGWIAEPEGA
jgi:hypothetical protein